MENDLKFSGQSPVTIDYNGSVEDIYAPVRTSSLDVNIVSDHILDDLYTARKNEICVKVRRKRKTYGKEIVPTYKGNLSSTKSYPNSMYYIYQKNQFFKDINGKFWFIGTIKDEYGNNTDVCLKFDTTNNVWKEDNSWGLDTRPEYKNQYFYDYQGRSWRVEYYNTQYEYNMHFKYVWDGAGWDYQGQYKKDQQDVETDMAYDCKHIVNYSDATELLFGKERYYWGPGKWFQTTSYWDNEQGGDYFAMYGAWCMRVKDKGGNMVDACIVNGLESSDGTGDWIVKLNRRNNTFKRLIKIESSYDLDNIFADDEGNVYCIKNSGELYAWNWDANAWGKWITFSGDAVVGSFYLDYIVPTSSGSIYVIKYTNSTTNNTEAIMLSSMTPPGFKEEKVWTGNYVYNTVWEGYKMPNTYSQPVTQNLDTINMTCIDPVSILKYITIDKLFTKPNIVTYRELIGKALAYVMINGDELHVERSVLYGSDEFDGENNILGLKVQVSNFWDEADKPSSVYDVIQEMLKPFCLTLAYDGYNYDIYSNNVTSTLPRHADYYHIQPDGELRWENYDDTPQAYWSVMREVLRYEDGDWISNNTQEATVEINNTYEKVNGIANTSVPSYTKMAIDLIDISQRDKYNYGDLNVQVNKTKGLVKIGENISPDNNDKWFYLWNGVYVNPDYDLESWNGYTDWYINMQQAYQYLIGGSTPSSDHGSILNFYGGDIDTNASGKTPTEEKSVQISKRITAYAADNGVPPEFLEMSDLLWSTNGHYLTKADQSSNTKFGSGIEMSGSNRIVYHQEYDNVGLFSNSNPVLNLNISRTFSRTGIDVRIPVMNNNTATNCSYNIWGTLTGADTYYFPPVWNEDKVKVDAIYFRRYYAGQTIGLISSSSRLHEVWDRRRIDMYIRLSDNNIIQFNGKEWVEDTEVKEENAFYLLKLMNFELLFHNDQRYNVIETADYDPEHPENGGHYSLSDESFIYYRDTLDHGVYDHDPGTSGQAMEAPPYNGAGQIVSSGDGYISVKLPTVEDAAPVVCVDVYNSSMLGMTGCDDIGSAGPCPFYYPKRNGDGYKEVTEEGGVWCSFLPKNLSHVKAEHIDLKISISVPESNLGQMFSQSDIEYVIDSKSGYVEEYNGPTFQVNTQNPLVASSYSYILYRNAYADPGEFIINGINTRPEAYTVQAYFNWLSRIRKIYTKTLVVLKENKISSLSGDYYIKDLLTNILKFITTPEIGDNPMMVISDSWDIKTDRHSITAIEADHLEVDYVSQFLVNELPHKARAERWNLPTVNKS